MDINPEDEKKTVSTEYNLNQSLWKSAKNAVKNLSEHYQDFHFVTTINMKLKLSNTLDNFHESFMGKYNLKFALQLRWKIKKVTLLFI